ncbi:MAG: hypothetical protein KAW41_04400 [Candidatus Diapherotrites archaeon]|nr:hypothetical protein [Candidatus Diapherotrites archaeon]
MGDLWTDLQLAAILFVFVYLTQWAIGMTGSRRVGILLAIIIVYLTIYQHMGVLVIVIALFFGYAFFETFENTFIPGPHPE